MRKPRFMHKAVTPKHDYDNPLLCGAKMSDENAHQYSRTNWQYVDCPKCMEISARGGRRSKWWIDMQRRKR